jgi:hypothetical protein
MGAWGYGVFDNDINLDFKCLAEREIEKGYDIKKAFDIVSKSEWFYNNQDEIMLAKVYMLNEKAIELTELEKEELKTAISNLLEETEIYNKPVKRKESLLNIIKEFKLNEV